MSEHDPRTAGARFYDLQPFPDDLPFYRARIPSPAASVLDLGCGTGRVTIGLADACREIHGVEISASMLEIAGGKVAALPPASRARVHLARGDITRLDLGRRFDLVLAPYRVFQALETDEQVHGLLDGVRHHLAPGGTCLLTMFNPMHDAETMRRVWVREAETPDWEGEIDGDRVVSSDRRPRLDPERLVLYPELVYRRYRGDELVETTVMPIVMRCWYPDQITALLRDRGFEIVATWGGYHGEAFGAGPELVVQFGAA